MTSRQLFAVVAVQAHWRGLAGRRGAVRRRRLAELYATEDATESESSGTAEGLHPVAAPRQRSTLSRGARAALRDAAARRSERLLREAARGMRVMLQQRAPGAQQRAQQQAALDAAAEEAHCSSASWRLQALGLPRASQAFPGSGSFAH